MLLVTKSSYRDSNSLLQSHTKSDNKSFYFCSIMFTLVARGMSILAWVHIESSAEFMKISGKSLSKFNANLKFVSKLWLPRL